MKKFIFYLKKTKLYAFGFFLGYFLTWMLAVYNGKIDYNKLIIGLLMSIAFPIVLSFFCTLLYYATRISKN